MACWSQLEDPYSNQDIEVLSQQWLIDAFEREMIDDHFSDLQVIKDILEGETTVEEQWIYLRRRYESWAWEYLERRNDSIIDSLT